MSATKRLKYHLAQQQRYRDQGYDYYDVKKERQLKKLTKLGEILSKMLDTPEEWKVHEVGYGQARRRILRHPRGDLALDVTYKYRFDVYGCACLSAYDRAHLWEKVKPVVEQHTGDKFMEFDNRCKETTRSNNQRKYYKSIMNNVLGVTNGSD